MKVRSKSIGSKAVRSKKVRWAKGHSSDSNPKTNRFRTEARGFRLPAASLSSSSHRIHQPSECVPENPLATEGHHHADCHECDSEHSEGTFQSNFTCTTLPSFQKLFGMWKTGSLLHKDILSVLGAVTEVIRSKGGSETEAEYFAAFLFTLSSFPEDNDNVVVATVYLINLISRHVTPNLLKAKLSTTLEILYSVLCQYAESSNWSLLRYLIDALGHILSVQEVTVWSQPLPRKVLDAMLTFTTSSNEGVRKSVARSVTHILSESQSVYVADLSVKFVCKQLGELSGPAKNPQSALLQLEFLGCITHLLPAQQLKNVFECLFKLLTVSQTSLNTAVLNVFLRFFQERPSIEKLPSELNCQLILALYDFAPSVSSAECVATWIFIMAEAHKCLLDRNLNLCVSQFHRCFQTLVSYLLNSNEIIATAAANNLQSICDDTITNLALRMEESKAVSAVLQKCITSLKDAITLQNFFRLQVILRITEKFASAIGTRLDQLSNLQSVVSAVAGLRDTDGFQLKSEADKCLGAFVVGLGPEKFLSFVPMVFNCEPPCVSLDIPHSWVLPLLREYTQKTRLKFFAEHFLILATKVKRSVDFFSANSMANELNVYSAVHQQIWDLLPSFCRSPVDLSEGLRAVGQIMGSALLQRPELRLTVLSALRTLVAECLYQPEKMAEMSPYCKNFMPILFNIYTTSQSKDATPGYDDRGVRLAVLETVRAVVKITPADLLHQYFNVALAKVKGDTASEPEKNSVLDLCITFVKYLNEDHVHLLFDTVEGYFNGPPSLQKKSYRILEEICCSETDGCFGYLTHNLERLKQLLGSDGSISSGAAKACRLQAISGLLKTFDEKDVAFVSGLLPTVAFCLKENNSKTRKRAGATMVEIVRFLKDHTGGVNSALTTVLNELDQYTSEGSCQEITSCLAAARLLLFEFRKEMPAECLSRMFHQASDKVGDEQRSVVQAALEFLSTAVGSASDVTMRMYLEEVVGCLFRQTPDCQRHFRFLTRKVLIKLTRKFGAETLIKLVPEKYHKQLAYVKKFCQRQDHKRQSEKKSNPTGESDGDDENDDQSVITRATTAKTYRSRPETVADLLRDSSDDEEEEVEVKRTSKGGKGSLWLKEDDEEDIVDLLDRSKLAQQIDTIDPKIAAARVERHEKKKLGGFKLSKDGRIIIGAEAGKAEEEEGRNGSDDDESILDCAKPTGKRRVAFNQDEYQPGGSGLHRKLDGGGSKSSDVQSRKRKGRTDEDAHAKRKKTRTGGGDANCQPYTYVPMEFEALNRRKRAKFQGRFNNLVRGATKGAHRGKKLKRK